MKTKEELGRDIFGITMKIHEEFPELSKYISEIPKNDSGIEPSKMNLENFKEYYNSLAELLSEYSKTHLTVDEKVNARSSGNDGYLSYPPSEDIYNEGIEEGDLDPENPSKTKTPNEPAGTPNEKDFKADKSGDDLDVPGSELDDDQERLGSEDEENNYYSLGADNHNDLEEDKG